MTLILKYLPWSFGTLLNTNICSLRTLLQFVNKAEFMNTLILAKKRIWHLQLSKIIEITSWGVIMEQALL